MHKKRPEPVNTQEAKTPEHQAIYHRLRSMILFGEVLPGQPLTIMGLKEEIGAGMTPVREAIRRLSAEGALELLGNRRICVPTLTLEQLDQISFARLRIEPELARRAAESADAALVADLGEIDSRVDDAIARGDVQGYLEQNHRFHFRIYKRAGADVLQHLAGGLWLRVGPSLRVVCGRIGTANLPDAHGRLIAALSAGDPVKACAAMEQDIRQGLDQIRDALTEGTEAGDGAGAN
jgi:DNA-binding GntR family transcriptional regulator